MPNATPSHLNPDNYCVFCKLGPPASASEISQGLHLKKTDNRLSSRCFPSSKKRRAIEELPGGRYVPSRRAEPGRPAKNLPQDAARHPQSSPSGSR